MVEHVLGMQKIWVQFLASSGLFVFLNQVAGDMKRLPKTMENHCQSQAILTLIDQYSASV